MTEGLRSGVSDAVKVAAGIWLFIWVDGLTASLDAKNKYLPVLLGLLQTVGAAVVVALVAALLNGICNRPKLDLEWRLSPGAVPSIGAPSIPATGQTVNVRLLIEGGSLYARWVRRCASSRSMNVVLRFRPDDAVILRIEDQTPRILSAVGDRITVRGLGLEPGLGCQADISVARRDHSTHPMAVHLDMSVEWTTGPRVLRAILECSVRKGPGVTGFDMRGV